MRAFFAVFPAPAEREALARVAAAWARTSGARAVAPANLHLTLLFLGAIDPAQRRAAQAAARAVALAAAPFPLALDRLGGFARARVAWAGPSQVPEAALALHAALREACLRAGVPFDARAFAPHVTLLRGAGSRAGAATPMLDPPVVLAVDRFALVASETTPAGVVYRPVRTFALGRLSCAGTTAPGTRPA
jgi:2'-5' RNA ligase